MKDLIVRRYRSQAQYQHDARRMLRRGYEVASVTSEQPRAGCLRGCLLGLLALLFKPKPVLIVTYRRVVGV